MAEYTASFLRDEIHIHKLYSVHYFEYDPDYQFVGESHDFWEMVYIDKGQAIIRAGDRFFPLDQGNIVFHKPGEFHSVHSNETAPSVAIVSFECRSKAMSFFEGRVLPVGQRQKEMISKIIAEYTGAYETPLNLVYCYKMEKLRKQVFGSEQLIKNYIAEFLISFIRQSQSRKTSQISRRRDDTRLNMLVNYMNANLSGRITLDGLASYSLLNKTSINKLFTDAFHLSPIEYFSHLKIDLAKKYIRENNYNITQISELLGYSGVHYFSRQFKKLVGMTPSEYSKSIKALNESRP